MNNMAKNFRGLPIPDYTNKDKAQKDSKLLYLLPFDDCFMFQTDVTSRIVSKPRYDNLNKLIFFRIRLL
jgi:hypothetical protein